MKTDIISYTKKGKTQHVTLPLVLSTFVRTIAIEEDTTPHDLCTHIYRTGLNEDEMLDRVWKFIVLHLHATVKEYEITLLRTTVLQVDSVLEAV